MSEDLSPSFTGKSPLANKIIEAKAKMGNNAANIIADHFKLEKWDGKKACCPFHNEDTPSFIFNEKLGHFKCFGCSRVYDILNLYMDQGLSYINAVKKLFVDTNTHYEDHELKSKENNKEYFSNYKYPTPETNTDRDKVEKYLEKRGISKRTLDFANIKQDKNGNIVFEHYNTDGELLCSKYRPSRAINKKKQVECHSCKGTGQYQDGTKCKTCKGTGKVDDQMMWWQPHSSTCPILYGVEKIDISKPLLITEGHIDRLTCIEAGFANTVSIPYGAADMQWIDFNWEWLNNFETIIIWADNDEAGAKFIKETTVRIGEDRCKIVTPPERVENKVLEFWQQYNKSIKKTDANNVLLSCGAEEVINLITNASDVPIPDVIKLMECPEFDITKALVLDTGVADLDNYIYGYVEGSLNVWTGKTGGGKSSFLLQSCLNESLNKGYDTFILSGELTSSQLKTWVISQLAGRTHMIEWDNGIHKPKTYTVTHEAKRKIEDKYMNSIFVYDSYLVATPEKVLSRMEYMRKKHGIINFIIDNLMCFELDIVKHGNELNAQKNLIIQFLQFAVRYGAIVHLVAHPKKPNGEVATTEYDILGSSNIPNLAHRIFCLRRVTDEEKEKGVPYNAYVSILKDRILGVSKKEVGLYYDTPSRRMFSDNDDVNKKYNWDDGSIKYSTDKFGDNGTLVKNLTGYERVPEFMKKEK